MEAAFFQLSRSHASCGVALVKRTRIEGQTSFNTNAVSMPLEWGRKTSATSKETDPLCSAHNLIACSDELASSGVNPAFCKTLAMNRMHTGSSSRIRIRIPSCLPEPAKLEILSDFRWTRYSFQF
jgi:hypothetical protein